MQARLHRKLQFSVVRLLRIPDRALETRECRARECAIHHPVRCAEMLQQSSRAHHQLPEAPPPPDSPPPPLKPPPPNPPPPESPPNPPGDQPPPRAAPKTRLRMNMTTPTMSPAVRLIHRNARNPMPTPATAEPSKRPSIA